MHYYTFNIGDYKSHTEHLSDLEDLAYRRLLDWYYLHEKPIPLNEPEIARQIRMRTHCDCIATVLREFFERTENGWIHHRADKEIARTESKSSKARESAKARWNKESDANALRTECDSNATHNTIHNTHNTIPNTKEKKTRVRAVVFKPDDVEQNVWDDFLAIRKAKKAPLTNTSLDGIRAEAAKAGLTLGEVLAECCSRGWQGFKASWMANNSRMSVAQKSETAYQRSMRLKMEQVCPNIAAKPPDETYQSAADFFRTVDVQAVEIKSIGGGV